MRRAIAWIVALLVLAGFCGLSSLAFLADLRRRQSAECPAIGALKTIATSEAFYREREAPHRYATLDQLREAKLVDPALGSGTKEGYLFEARPSTTTPEFLWWAVARPVDPAENPRIFFTNQAGVIFYVIPPAGTSVTVDPETAAIPSDFVPTGK